MPLVTQHSFLYTAQIAALYYSIYSSQSVLLQQLSISTTLAETENYIKVNSPLCCMCPSSTPLYLPDLDPVRCTRAAALPALSHHTGQIKFCDEGVGPSCTVCVKGRSQIATIESSFL